MLVFRKGKYLLLQHTVHGDQIGADFIDALSLVWSHSRRKLPAQNLQWGLPKDRVVQTKDVPHKVARCGFAEDFPESLAHQLCLALLLRRKASKNVDDQLFW